MDEVNFNWFHNGLRFKCTGCGKCCTGAPGYVFLSPSDVKRFADYFKLSVEEFSKRYTRDVDGQTALIDKADSEDCVFLEDKRCTAYEGRPVQCRTFPWWAQHLNEPENWEEAALRCEGINHPDAPLVESLEIQQQALAHLDNFIELHFSLN